MGTSWTGVDQGLHDGFNALAQAVAEAGGILVLSSTIRTRGEQKRLYDRFKAGLSGGLPAAPPGHSAHERGWAFDAVVNPHDWQPDVGALWRSIGGTWGAKTDPVHFELPGAGPTAWKLGEEEAAGTTPDTQNTFEIGLLPRRWKNYIYSAEDIALGFVPVAGQVQLISFLLSLGYPDSEILKILGSPVSELHRLFPWFPF